MKKTLICGMASLALAAMPTFGVFAESLQGDSETGYFTGSKSVTAGEVDETIYSVDIDWGDMVFDWKYNFVANNFGFKARLGCEGYSTTVDGFDFLNQAKENGTLYADSNCSTLQTDELVNGNTYYRKTGIGGHFYIQDSSVNGRVTVQASFVPREDYDWVVGKFASSYELNVTTGEVTYAEDSDNGYLVSQLGGPTGRFYHSWLHLETNGDSVSSESVTAEDTIGTIVVSIEPDTTPITD